MVLHEFKSLKWKSIEGFDNNWALEINRDGIIFFFCILFIFFRLGFLGVKGQRKKFILDFYFKWKSNVKKKKFLYFQWKFKILVKNKINKITKKKKKRIEKQRVKSNGDFFTKGLQKGNLKLI